MVFSGVVNCHSLFTDVDDCINNTCKNDATCINGVNSYTCNCSVGYTGGYCENSKLENFFYIISWNLLVFCHLLIFTFCFDVIERSRGSARLIDHLHDDVNMINCLHGYLTSVILMIFK